MKKIILLGIALLAMVSCEKYDDSDVWNAINDLKAKQENASKEGVTPVVKTVNEEMFISYDNGATWTKMSNGMYSEISYDERYVVFTLTDGTELKVLNANYVVPIEKGAIKAAFSVGEGKQVYFSQGNLQYQASTGIWRFATNQWEAIGEGNANIAEDYDGWIDLFGYGTSGWNSGAVCYQPYSNAGNASDYFPGGQGVNNDLTDIYSFCDWGVYNKIYNGGDVKAMWRVLTADEWNYVMNKRPEALKKYGVANVNGVNGLILLPDVCVIPENIPFSPGYKNSSEPYNYTLKNNYNLSQWMEFEKLGAIFLPASGYRECSSTTNKINIHQVNQQGFYWSTTVKDGYIVYHVKFMDSYVGAKNDSGSCRQGISVRLVQDVK